MTTLAITLGTMITMAVLTALQIRYMARRWTIKEAEFAKKWDLSAVFVPREFNFDTKFLQPASHFKRLQELAEAPSPELDRLEAELAATANDPEATDETLVPPDSSNVA
jgi:hypothetical protein